MDQEKIEKLNEQFMDMVLRGTEQNRILIEKGYVFDLNRSKTFEVVEILESTKNSGFMLIKNIDGYMSIQHYCDGEIYSIGDIITFGITDTSSEHQTGIDIVNVSKSN